MSAFRIRRALPALLLGTLLVCSGPGMAAPVDVEQARNAAIARLHDLTQRARDNAVVNKARELTGRASDLALEAINMLGISYKRGGNTPENGLDCSGLVRLVFKESWGKTLPRTAAEISKVGTTVKTSELQPGDLVFYNTLRRGFSHVGIYLGDNKFIHAPSAGGQVRIESMDIAYWKQRFNGARRVEAPAEAMSPPVATTEQ
jgi:cell wall-associated NlpC family hydrolase